MFVIKHNIKLQKTLVYIVKIRIMLNLCEVIFRNLQFFHENSIVKLKIAVYNDIKIFNICYIN